MDAQHSVSHRTGHREVAGPASVLCARLELDPGAETDLPRRGELLARHDV
jgi:hypothetical protein